MDILNKFKNFELNQEDRMPKEDGDIEKLTLQEMLDKKLIFPTKVFIRENIK